MAKYKTLIIGFGILVVILICFGIYQLWYLSARNGIITEEQNVNASWSQVQNVYQRRQDLIPNLVETVKGYAKQESSVLTQVTELRSKVGSMTVTKEILNDPAAFQKFQEAQNELSSALSRLLVVSEAYPDLKSSENFMTLQSQLEGAENRIAVERRRFIEAVQAYNTKIKRWPTSIVASKEGYVEKANFTASAGAEKAPEVKF